MSTAAFAAGPLDPLPSSITLSNKVLEIWAGTNAWGDGNSWTKLTINPGSASTSPWISLPTGTTHIAVYITHLPSATAKYYVNSALVSTNTAKYQYYSASGNVTPVGGIVAAHGKVHVLPLTKGLATLTVSIGSFNTVYDVW